VLQVTGTLETYENRLHVTEVKERVQLEWQQLALVVDRALFCVFLSTTMLTIFVLLIYPALFQDKRVFV
jgi:hypothetical protein